MYSLYTSLVYAKDTDFTWIPSIILDITTPAPFLLLIQSYLTTSQECGLVEINSTNMIPLLNKPSSLVKVVS